MIKIPDPSMSVNSPELMAYRLFNTRIVDEYVTPFWLATNIKSIAVNCPGGRLATLVINCHGFVNEKQEFVGLDIGTGLYKTDIGPNFDRLKGLIDLIHIPAC